MQDFLLSVLFHFIARIDFNEKLDLKGCVANIIGIENIIEIVKRTSTVKRVIFASS